MFEALMLSAGFALGMLLGVLSRKIPPARRVANKQRKGNEAGEYILVMCRLDGEDVCLLLTQHETDAAIERAVAHPEDLWGKK